jgi:catechol 2,3-dioxygenase-like lactoylglutathione lyase family enzyme
MNLVSTRIITSDVQQLVQFYKQITGITAIHYTEDFAEVRTPTATLAIGSTRTLQFFGGEDVAKAAHNRSMIIEFKVDNVDTVYEKIELLIEPDLVQQPTTMPWGNRSLLFRDPDGNLVNFFTPITGEAIARTTTK